MRQARRSVRARKLARNEGSRSGRKALRLPIPASAPPFYLALLLRTRQRIGFVLCCSSAKLERGQSVCASSLCCSCLWRSPCWGFRVVPRRPRPIHPTRSPRRSPPVSVRGTRRTPRRRRATTDLPAVRLPLTGIIRGGRSRPRTAHFAATARTRMADPVPGGDPACIRRPKVANSGEPSGNTP